MNELKTIAGLEVQMDSREIAQLLGKQHGHILRAIRKMFDVLVEDGQISRGDASKFGSVYMGANGEERPCFVLNKKYTLVLLTNYDFRVAGRVVNRIEELEDNLNSQRIEKLEWQQARLEGKVSRRSLTDVIKEFVVYSEEQGSRNAKMYYANITKGTYKALYILEKGGSCKELRERLSTMQLNQLATAEAVALRTIAEHMEIGTHYKDIYKIAIAKVVELSDLLGKQLPGEDQNIFKLK